MDARAGSLWHKRAGVAIPRTTPRHRGGPLCSRSFPEGKIHWKFSYPFSHFKNVVITPDETNLVCYNGDNTRPTLYVHSTKNGSNLYTIPVKYNGFKEVLKIVPLPDKPSVVAMIDVDKEHFSTPSLTY